MPLIKLPTPGRNAPDARRMLDSIVGHDQFDDWIPDPALYADYASRQPTAFLERLDRAARAGALDVVVERVDLPRADGVTTPAARLPLDARVAAGRTIAAMSARIGGALRRDKVYGFEYRPKEPALFSPPGEGLGLAFGSAWEAAKQAKNAAIHIVDVVGFQRTATLKRLSATLGGAGAHADEIAFLSSLIEGANGLPSIDDSFACVYNFYLHPVDSALFQKRRNFFRYRDEYFVLGAATRRELDASLKLVELSARLVHEFSTWTGMDKKGPDTGADEEEEEFEVLFDDEERGRVVARFVCTAYERPTKTCTDRYELRDVSVNDPPPEALKELFEHKPDRLLDAVRALPGLRYANQRRAEGVLWGPAFGGTARLQEYRREMAAQRVWLRRAIATAIARASDWQIAALAPLLTDAGPARQGRHEFTRWRP